MRTTINVDEGLLAKAMVVAGSQDAEATIEEALKALVRLGDQREILNLVGKVEWSGDLDEMRRD